VKVPAGPKKATESQDCSHPGRIVNEMDELCCANSSSTASGACAPRRGRTAAPAALRRPGLRQDRHHRPCARLPEAVYGPERPTSRWPHRGRAPERAGGPVLLSRPTPHRPRLRGKAAAEAGSECTVRGRPVCATVAGDRPPSEPPVLIVTAGTADCRWPRSASRTARARLRPLLLADCGVAGVHRLLASADELADADAVVVGPAWRRPGQPRRRITPARSSPCRPASATAPPWKG